MGQAKKVTCLDCGQVNRVPQEHLDAGANSGAKCGTCGAKLIQRKVVEVDLATLQKAARNDDLPLVVDFWAPWCGPCRMMAPEYAKASTELLGQARFVKINTEDHPKASSKYRIRGIPTMAGFVGGKEKARQSGAMKAAAIVRWVRASV